MLVLGVAEGIGLVPQYCVEGRTPECGECWGSSAAEVVGGYATGECWEYPAVV